MSDFTPRAFVKTNCPYSFKFRLFVSEAGLDGKFQFHALDPDADDFAATKEELRKLSGGPVRFPTVEIEPGKFMNGSDEMIAHYAKAYGIDDGALATLSFYRRGLFPTFLELFDLCAKPLAWLIRLGRRPRAFR